jgi:hypothetical protein
MKDTMKLQIKRKKENENKAWKKERGKTQKRIEKY